MPFRARRSRALIATACLAAAIGVPGSALAQSAGNDQYQDPLAGQTTTQAAPPTGTATLTPQLTPTAGSGSSSGTTAPAGTPATRTGPSTSTTASPTQATTTSLPNTGVDGRILAALGAGLLLCGFGLRLRTARERF